MHRCGEFGYGKAGNGRSPISGVSSVHDSVMTGDSLSELSMEYFIPLKFITPTFRHPLKEVSIVDAHHSGAVIIESHHICGFDDS